MENRGPYAGSGGQVAAAQPTRAFIRDPVFMRDVALVCAALHNIYQLANCEYNDQWNVDQANYVLVGQANPPVLSSALPSGGDVRFAIARKL